MTKSKYNNKIVILHDNTKAIFYFGKWVDPNTKAVISLGHYPELKEPWKLEEVKNITKKVDEKGKEIEGIDGGAIVLARQLFESELWLNKPSQWCKIWLYILARVNHKDTKTCRRGEGFFNFAQERIRIGKDVKKDQIKKFMGWAKTCTMISTTRSTRGIFIKVLAYDKYQTLNNYASTSKSTKKRTSKALLKHPDSKECKNERIKKDKFNELEQILTPMQRMKFDELSRGQKASTKSVSRFERIVSSYLFLKGKDFDMVDVGNLSERHRDELHELRNTPIKAIFSVMAKLSQSNSLTVEAVHGQLAKPSSNNKAKVSAINKQLMEQMGI